MGNIKVDGNSKRWNSKIKLWHALTEPLNLLSIKFVKIFYVLHQWQHWVYLGIINLTVFISLQGGLWISCCFPPNPFDLTKLKSLISAIIKRDVVSVHIMQKEVLVNLTLKGHIEGKRDRGKHNYSYFNASIKPRYF